MLAFPIGTIPLLTGVHVPSWLFAKVATWQGLAFCSVCKSTWTRFANGNCGEVSWLDSLALRERGNQLEVDGETKMLSL